MKLVMRLAVPALAGVIAFAASEHQAHALGPIDVEAGLKVGVGSNPNSDGVNPYGVGVGGRAGVGIFHLYAGLSAIHYFGGSDGDGQLEVKSSSTLIGGELGYTITSIPVVQLRPQIGVGNAHFSNSVGGTDLDGDDKLYLEPGVTALVPLGLLYVGADVNALIVPSVAAPTLSEPDNKKTFTALTVHAQFGIRF